MPEPIRLDDHRMPPPVVWPQGFVEPARASTDDFPELHVSAVLEQGMGESIQLVIHDTDEAEGIQLSFDQIGAHRLANLLLNAIRTLQTQIFPTNVEVEL